MERTPQRWRTLLPAAISVVVLAYVLSSNDRHGGAAVDDDDTDGADTSKLRVEWIEPVELSPGAAVIVHLQGLQADAPLSARVSSGELKLDAPLLHREGARAVVQMPGELPRGTVKLRMLQGERRSKPRLLQIRPVPVRDVLRDVLGGLALFVLGLRTVGMALRTYAGRRVRKLLERLTGSGPGAVGLGAMVGGLTQSTTSSAGVLAGLIEARMLPVATAMVMLLGVQLGAASAGALLPLVATREALWVIVLGALWVGFADDRRARAFGNIILGCGLLFLGLRLLQDGFRPLLANPELLPYLHHLKVQGPGSALLAAGAGALLCGLLQGPGPVFAVVLSLSETSGLIGLVDGLAILAGTAVGAVVGTAAVGAPLGRRGLRLALGHLMLGALMTAVALVGLELWASGAEALAPGEANARSYASRALLPNVGVHLGVGFALSQLAAVAAAMLAAGPVARRAGHLIPSLARTAEVPLDEGWLTRPLLASRAALVALDQVHETRDRDAAVTAERALSDVRRGAEQMLQSRGAAGETGPTLGACLHLAASLDAALQVAETAVERNFVLEPADGVTLAKLQQLLLSGMDALIAHASGEDQIVLDAARAREIEINALEGEARRDSTRLEEASPETIPYRLWFSELLVAYETVGNHLYRLATQLAEDDEL